MSICFFSGVNLSSEATSGVATISRVNERYWMDLRGCYEWNIDFKLYKKVSLLYTSTSDETAEPLRRPSI